MAASVAFVLPLLVASSQLSRILFVLNAALQDGAKGYDIIEFCFLRPEFNEVPTLLPPVQPPSAARLPPPSHRHTRSCFRWNGRTKSTGE